MSSCIAEYATALRQALRRLRVEEHGAILVETALIAPLMISLSAGVFEFGNLIHQKLLIEAGLNDGARYIARCTDSFTGLNCQNNGKDIAAYGVVGGTVARVDGWAAAAVTVQIYDTANPVDPVTGLQAFRGQNANVRTVRVTTSFNYTGASLLSYLGIGPVTLAGSHEERFIGY